MAYSKTNWVNNTTPINETNLNKIEQGIYDNSLVVDAITNTLNPTDTETYKTAELTEGQITDVIGVNDILIKGQTSQNGEPTPDTPQDIKVVTGDNKVTISNADNTEKKELPISLGSLELCRIGDCQDYIYKKDEKWYKHKKVEKLILNGSNYVFYLNESTILPNPTYHRFITFFSQKGLNSEIVNCYSNKFKNTTGSELWNNDISGIAQSQTQIIIRTNKASNDNEIKTWLSQNNLTGYFSLTTPTEEEITDTTLISQLEAIYNAPLYEQTNITQTNNDLPMVLDITACKDNIKGIKAFIRK